MAAPKAKTLQQKLGFFDEDLKSPAHDDILKWLDNNLIDFIYEIYDLKGWNKKQIEEQQLFAKKMIEFNIEKAYKEIEIQEGEKKKYVDALPQLEKNYEKYNEKEKANAADNRYYTQNWGEAVQENKSKQEEIGKEIKLKLDFIDGLKKWGGLGEIPERNAIRIIDKPWEYCITSQSSGGHSGYKSGKNVVGFIDLKVSFVYTKLRISGLNYQTKEITSELKWVQTEDNYDRYNNKEGLNTYTFYVEVKTRIPSLGELFRQLKMYQEYVKGPFVIVSPDDAEKDLIISQEYLFYKFENKN